MEWLLPSAFFALGAIVASFIGCAAARLNSGADLLFGRSACDTCGATLSPLELVPILSWALGRGRCAYCSARVPIISTLAEITLGGLFALSYLKLGATPAFILLLIALSALLGLVLYDLAHTIIPAAFLVPFLFFSFAFSLSQGESAFLFGLEVGVIEAGFLALLHFFSGGRAMGLADAPLTLGLAVLTSRGAIAGFLFSFWIGAVVGMCILAAAPRGHRMGIEVPFAPYLAIGFLLAYFSGWDPLALIATLLTPVISP